MSAPNASPPGNRRSWIRHVTKRAWTARRIRYRYRLGVINRSLAARLLGPTGLVIAGLGLLLPFGAVSCSAEGSAQGQSASVTYTGAEVIGNSGGTFSATPGFPYARQALAAFPAKAGSPLSHEADVTGTRILLIVMVGLLVVGVLAVLIRQRLVRMTMLAAVAVSAAILLVAAQISARHAVLRYFAKNRSIFSPEDAHQALPDGFVVRIGAGFWVSLALLIVVAVGSVVAIFWYTRPPGEPGAAVPALPDGEETKT